MAAIEPNWDEFDQEQLEWLEALEDIRREYGENHVKALLRKLQDGALSMGITLNEATLNTPYVNSIPVDRQPAYPGDIAMETRLENIIRWNAMAMVLRAQDSGSGVGGHIATYGSAATLMEVGFNHFFRAKTPEYNGDLILPQPHAAPGIYARAFLEGRLSEQQLGNFRRETQAGGGFELLPSPAPYAGFLASTLRLNGPLDAHRDIPSAVCKIFGESWAKTKSGRQGMVLHR